MSNEKRVVVTGMGIVSSIGNNVEEVKNSLVSQKSGIVKAELIQFFLWDKQLKMLD